MNNPDYNNCPIWSKQGLSTSLLTWTVRLQAWRRWVPLIRFLSTVNSNSSLRLIQHCFKQRIYSLIWHGEQGRKRLHERRGYREEVTANSSPACCQLITGRVVKLIAALCAWGVCKWASYTLRVACVAAAAACWSMPSALHLLTGRDK
jgi:hypothetical protein